jgi:hypothetical protein
MIEYKNKVLKTNAEEVTSADYILHLDSDTDAKILGKLIYPDGSTRIIEFVDNENDKISRVVTSEKEFKQLSNVKLQLILISGSMNESSNIEQLKFNKELVKTDIRKHFFTEYEEIKKELIALQEEIKTLSEGKIISKLNLINKNAIRKGMIPVAIDDNGNFAALYPFANNITKINGQCAANGVVVIDSSMIQYKTGKSIETALDDNADAARALANAVRELSNVITTLNSRVDELDIRLTQHINNGIV